MALAGQSGGRRAAVLAVHLVELVPVAGLDVGEGGHPGIETEDLLLESRPQRAQPLPVEEEQQQPGHHVMQARAMKTTAASWPAR